MPLFVTCSSIPSINDTTFKNKIVSNDYPIVFSTANKNIYIYPPTSSNVISFNCRDITASSPLTTTTSGGTITIKHDTLRSNAITYSYIPATITINSWGHVTGVTYTSAKIKDIIKTTQSNYNTLTKDSNTLYLIT